MNLYALYNVELQDIEAEGTIEELEEYLHGEDINDIRKKFQLMKLVQVDVDYKLKREVSDINILPDSVKFEEWYNVYVDGKLVDEQLDLDDVPKVIMEILEKDPDIDPEEQVFVECQRLYETGIEFDCEDWVKIVTHDMLMVNDEVLTRKPVEDLSSEELEDELVALRARLDDLQRELNWRIEEGRVRVRKY